MSEHTITTHTACRATAHALRPSAVRAITTRPDYSHDSDLITDDPHARIAQLLTEAMSTDRLLERAGPWWTACGPALTDALAHVSDVDRTAASYLLGAAVHAHILAGTDLAQDAVLRLAERATTWHLGTRWVLDELDATLARLDTS